MNRIAQFEKVSFEQFYTAAKDLIASGLANEATEEKIREIYDNITLPHRSTKDSAGYDIHSTVSAEMYANQTLMIPTGIRVKIDEGWFMACFPRSGLGFKYRLQLNNTVGIVDGDYYYSDNEGHIFLKLTNATNEGKKLTIERGDRIAQAIFLPYGITYNDDASGTRNGGMGSTGF